MLNTTIDQDNLMLPVSINFLPCYAYLSNKIILAGIVQTNIPVFKNYLTQHSPLFPEDFGKMPGINSVNARYLVGFKPVRKTHVSVPVTVFSRII